MIRRNYFKLALIISVAVHFSLILVSPVWTTTTEQETPEIIKVELITVKPEKPKPEPKAAAAPPPPPPIQKEVEKKPPPLEPVEMPVKPSQDIPVLTPRTEFRNDNSIPLPTLPANVVTSTREERPPERVAHEVAKTTRTSTQAPSTPSRISSPIEGEQPSFVASPAGEQGEAITTSTDGPVGITFRGLGTRRPTRAPMPSYPPRMEQIGVEGTGTVMVYVSPGGQVIDVDVIETSGRIEFDQEIRATLMRYGFSDVPPDIGIQSYRADFEFSFVR